MLDNRLEQRPQIGGFGVERWSACAVARNGIEDRKVDLFFAGVQVDEQVVDCVEDCRRTGVLPVDLIDDHDGGKSQHQGLQQHRACLRQRPFRGVDE